MVSAIDFLPWLRPSPDRYHYLVFNQLMELVQSGGYRCKFAASETAFGVNDLSSTGIFTRDSYLYVRPGSYAYAITLWAPVNHAFEPVTSTYGNSTLGYDKGTCLGEVELIDSNTRETWWRSSEDVASLGFFDYQDTMQIENSSGAVVADKVGMGINTWYLPDRRLFLGEGPQQVRFTSNSNNAGQLAFQIMIHLFEPVDAGVNLGI